MKTPSHWSSGRKTFALNTRMGVPQAHRGASYIAVITLPLLNMAWKSIIPCCAWKLKTEIAWK